MVIAAVLACALLLGTASAADRRAGELIEQARQLGRNQDYAGAAEVLRRSLALDPSQLQAYYLLGVCYEFLGRFEEAGKTYLKAAGLPGSGAEPWLYTGRMYYDRNFFDKALAALEKAKALSPRDPRVLEYMGLTLSATGDTDGARQAYLEAIRYEGAQPAPLLHMNYGALLHQAGLLEESEKQLRIAIDAAPRNWRPRLEMARLKMDQNRFESAVEELNAALRDPAVGWEDRVRMYRLLARAYYTLGREKEGRAAAAHAEGPQP